MIDGWIKTWIDTKKGSPTIQPFVVQQWSCSVIHDSQQPSSPIGFLSSKVPPPPCAVLLVNKICFNRQQLFPRCSERIVIPATVENGPYNIALCRLIMVNLVSWYSIVIINGDSWWLVLKMNWPGTGSMQLAFRRTLRTSVEDMLCWFLAPAPHRSTVKVVIARHPNCEVPPPKIST